MPLRYTDLDTPKSAYSDFVIRRRRPTLAETFIICVGLIIFAAGISLTASSNDKLALIAVLFILGGCLCLYSITQIKHGRVLLQKTEFENALFASALNMNYAFSFIVDNEGAIVYISPGFKDLFTAFAEADHHDLKAWMEDVHLQADQATAITQAIEGGSKKELACHLLDDQEQRTPYRMLIEPIPRPKGFILVRCRPDTSVQEPTCKA